MRVFTLCAARFGSTVINGIDDQNMSRNVQEFLNATDGNITPSMAGIMTEEPMFDFQSFLVNAVLAAIPFTGLALVGSGEFWFREMEDGAALKTTGIKIAVTRGIAVISRIEAQQGSEAKATVEVHMASLTGTNRPFTVTMDAALPTLTPITEKWTAGPIVLGGTTVDAQGWTLDNGYDISRLAHSGLAYPSWCSIRKHEPRFTANCYDLSKFNTWNPGATTLNNIFYLRKMAEGSDRVAEGTVQHISLNCAKAFTTAERASASQGGEATVELNVRPVVLPPNAILTANTAVAIT